VIFNALVAKSVDQGEFAIFSLSVTLGFFFWSIVDSGITAYSIKKVAQSCECDLPDLFQELSCIRLQVVCFFSIALAFFLIVLPLSSYESTVYACSLLYILAIAILPAWFSQGVQENKSYLITYLVIAFMIILSMIGLYLQSYFFSPLTALNAILWRNIFMLLGSIFTFIVLIKEKGIKFSIFKFPSNTLTILKETFPLGMASIFYSIVPVMPQFYLRGQGINKELALYTSIWTIQHVLIAGTRVLKKSFLPSLSKGILIPKLKRKIIIIQSVIAFCAASMASIIWYFFGAYIIFFLFGQDYIKGANLLIYFSSALFFIFIRTFIDSFLIVQGQYKKMYKSGILAVAGMIFFISFHENNSESCAFMYLLGEFILLFSNGCILFVILCRR
jgi:O-antigen/teichoic acid export membrane protein